MWVQLSRRLRTWVLLAVTIPVARAVVHRANLAAHQRRSNSTLTSLLERADGLLTRQHQRHRNRGAKGGWL